MRTPVTTSPAWNYTITVDGVPYTWRVLMASFRVGVDAISVSGNQTTWLGIFQAQYGQIYVFGNGNSYPSPPAQPEFTGGLLGDTVKIPGNSWNVKAEGPAVPMATATATGTPISPTSTATSTVTPMPSVTVAGPVAYWPLDDGSGTVATDASRNGHHLSLVNGPQWTSGIRNGAILLDGLNDYLVSSSTVLNPATTDLTVAAWFRLNSSGTHQTILAQEDGTGTGRIWLRVDGNTSRLSSFLGGSPSEATTVVATETWYHGALVKSGSTLTFYLNGAFDGQVTRTAESATGNTRLGANKATGSLFNGFLDEVRVYNTALSPQDMQQLYESTQPAATSTATPAVSATATGTPTALATSTSTLSPTPASTLTSTATATPTPSPTASPSPTSTTAALPVAYWPLDDGSGTVATDASGNGHHLSLVNGPQWTTGIRNGAILLDGLNDYLVSSSTVLNPSTTDLTVAAWFRLTSSGTHQAILAQEDGTGTGRIWLRVDGNTGRLSSFLGGTPSEATTAVATGTWYHGALVKSGSTLTFYLNGAFDGQATRTAESATGNTRLGANRTGGSLINGILDEVRVYNTALSPQQIQQLFQSP